MGTFRIIGSHKLSIVVIALGALGPFRVLRFSPDVHFKTLFNNSFMLCGSGNWKHYKISKNPTP